MTPQKKNCCQLWIRWNTLQTVGYRRQIPPLSNSFIHLVKDDTKRMISIQKLNQQRFCINILELRRKRGERKRGEKVLGAAWQTTQSKTEIMLWLSTVFLINNRKNFSSYRSFSRGSYEHQRWEKGENSSLCDWKHPIFNWYLIPLVYIVLWPPTKLIYVFV